MKTMKFLGIVDVLQQRRLIRERKDLIKDGAFVPLHPKEINQFDASQSWKGCTEKIARIPDDAVILVEASVVVKCTHLPQLSGSLQELLNHPRGEYFTWVLAVASENHTATMREGSIFLKDPEMLGGYVRSSRTNDPRGDPLRYTCLQEVALITKEHELRSIFLFFQYIMDSVKNYDFSFGPCTFEYVFWPQALKECCDPAFNVIVV